MEPGIAGNWAQFIIFVGLCFGWVGSYLYRVATKVGARAVLSFRVAEAATVWDSLHAAGAAGEGGVPLILHLLRSAAPCWPRCCSTRLPFRPTTLQ